MSKRATLFVTTLLVGLALAVLGVFLSAPIGLPDSPTVSNPRVQFAPALFVLGVTLMFASAVVYEIVPDHWDK